MGTLVYKIARLWGSPQGTVEKYNINQKITYPEDADLDFSGNFIAELRLLKLKDAISVLLNDASIEARFICTLCLKRFAQKVEIPEAEGQFFYDKTQITPVEADLYFIDRKNMTIDLSGLVRQEIILHFPLIPVCSSSCKGLCARCGKDKNVVACKCKDKEAVIDNKPLKNLKKIYGNL